MGVKVSTVDEVTARTPLPARKAARVVIVAARAEDERSGAHLDGLVDAAGGGDVLWQDGIDLVLVLTGRTIEETFDLLDAWLAALPRRRRRRLRAVTATWRPDEGLGRCAARCAAALERIPPATCGLALPHLHDG